MDAVYVDQGDRIVPTRYAAGPWDRRFQHGGAPAALLARAVEHQVTNVAGQIVRLTVELMRPVPISPLKVTTRAVREGRKAQFLEATLSDGATDVARGTAVRLRTRNLELPEDARMVTGPTPTSPERAEPLAPPPPEDNPFFSGIETRVAAGDLRNPGPATAWFRLRRPIIAGEEPSPLMRVAAVADFANGIASVLDLDNWSYANADLTIWCHRYPVGHWVSLDSQSSLSASGIGCTHSRLFDTTGPVGWSAQSLLIESRQG